MEGIKASQRRLQAGKEHLTEQRVWHGGVQSESQQVSEVS